MSKPVSIAVSLGLLAAFAITALAVGRPTLPLFDELPLNTATGFIAYESNDCVFVADLERATINKAFCPSPDDEEGFRYQGIRFEFTADGMLHVGTGNSHKGVLVDPVSGLPEGERVWEDRPEGPTPEDTGLRYVEWKQETQSDGLLVTIDRQEHLLVDVPNAYRIHNMIFSPDDVWVAAQDNAGQLVLLGPSGPWVVDTDLNDYTQMLWASRTGSSTSRLKYCPESWCSKS